MRRKPFLVLIGTLLCQIPLSIYKTTVKILKFTIKRMLSRRICELILVALLAAIMTLLIKNLGNDEELQVSAGAFHKFPEPRGQDHPAGHQQILDIQNLSNSLKQIQKEIDSNSSQLSLLSNSSNSIFNQVSDLAKNVCSTPNNHDSVYLIGNNQGRPMSFTTKLTDVNTKNTIKMRSLNYVCCYQDINDPEINIGRPFPLDEKVEKTLNSYMNSETMTITEKHEFLSINDDANFPQPVTAFSSNHFHEHTTQIVSALRLFGANHEKNWRAIPIIVYDLGLSPEHIDYLKKNDSFIYRKLDFDSYPPHVGTLCTYSWKTIIWAKILTEFKVMLWFDTSMWFSAKDRLSLKKTLNRYINGKSSSVYYYVHKGVHNISYATHANMLSYLPSTLENMEKNTKCSMSQANGIIIFNTNEVKHHIMKWGLLCALTKDCIAPPSVWDENERKKVKTFCPKTRQEMGQRHICHRYDQSLFSILIRNFYRYDDSRYQAQGDLDYLGAPQRVG